MKLPCLLCKNRRTVTRIRGWAASCRLPTPAQPPPSRPPLPPGVAPPTPPPHAILVVLSHGGSATWLMINTARCRTKSSLSRGAVIPVWGCAHWRRPGPGGPLCGEVARGAAPGSVVGGGGGGGGAGRFRGAAATAIVPGRIRQRHHLPDAGSHGPGPAPFGGVARQSSRLWPGGHLARPQRDARGCMVKRLPRGVGCVYCFCGRWWWLWRWCVKVSFLS